MRVKHIGVALAAIALTLGAAGGALAGDHHASGVPSGNVGTDDHYVSGVPSGEFGTDDHFAS
ncbi:hypothetical protein AB0948_12235 [Streptomyces koyangensis]|uniref:hypothetical protein n=1 Tax=Streptomyces koyangensis TaxID=188770 RepID=UPI00345703CD